MNRGMRSATRLLAAGGLLLLSASCAMDSRLVAAQSTVRYTRINMWYESPAKIFNLNYHRGAMISAGTRVKIVRVRRDHVVFNMENSDEKYVVYFLRAYAARDAGLLEFFESYFSESDPTGPGTSYDGFSAMEKDQIAKGEIAIGMSKGAVIMAYGYPPGHITPSLDRDAWKYWISRMKNLYINFKNNRVSHIGE